MDLISVIIPYYKKKKYIDRSISSVINQTYTNFEIILVYDDDDKSELSYLINSYNSNKKISFIKNKKNIGAGLSRNLGISKAKGKYIGFLDADDVWEKNKIEKQIKFMKDKKFKVSHTSYKIIGENNEFIGRRKARTFYSYKEILKSCDIGLSTIIMERNIIKNNIKFSNQKTKEDFILWLKILKKKIPIGGLDQILSSWRSNKNSLSSSTYQKLIDGFRVYNKHMGYNKLMSIYLLICLSLNFLKKKYYD